MEKRKILIVDDQPEMLELLDNLFTEEKLPYEIMKAPNGGIALQVIEKTLPDLIITDWEMPHMDGIEFIKELKKNKITEDIPVIMNTGVMTSSENLETALQAGAVDYIRKPVDKIELIARTRANLHLADNYKKIKEINESKDRIFSIIAHDLKAPIGNIKSFLELILARQSKYDREKILETLTKLSGQSTAAYNILENLLLWANSQRNNIKFNPKLQKVNLAIDGNISLLQNTADQKNIALSNETSDDLNAFFDLTSISTVVRNLIANAIKFTPDNGRITINAVHKDQQIIISISDTGIGISPDRAHKLLKDNSNETTLGTNEEQGSGLGLMLCKYFVEQHNGKIWVESKVDMGSKFIFTLKSTK